jgi:hypothetical protein
MNASIRLVTLVALVVIGSGCNRRDSPFDDSWQPSTLPGAQPGVSSVTFQPSQALAGSPVWVAVSLTFPAPVGGVDVSLTGDSAIESLPSRITVPAGSQRVVFQIATRESSGDRNATVRASAAFGAPATGTLQLWATVADSCAMQGNFSVRLMPPEARVWGVCERGGGLVRIWFTRRRGWSSDTLHAEFAAPQGMPLSVGTYEGAMGYWYPTGLPTPALDVTYQSNGCSWPNGRFIVRAVDCAPDGTVRQFWVTYELHCSAGSVGIGGTYGDIRVTNAPREF